MYVYNIWHRICFKNENVKKMTNQFSQTISEILAYSREEAIRLSNSEVGPEHLLLGIIRLIDREKLPIKQLFPDTLFVKKMLEEKVVDYYPIENNDNNEVNLNEKASNILKLAVLEARLQRKQKVDEHHLLLAMLHDSTNNGAKETMESANINYNKAKNMLKSIEDNQNNNISIDTQTELPERNDALELPDDEDYEEYNNIGDNSNSSSTTQTKQKSKTPVIDNFGTDLTKAALEGKLDPVVGREKEIQRVIEILGRRKKNNPILIGEPGVGKSAIVEGLAQLIATKHTSPMLFNKRIVNLDLTAIVAGTKYRGQFEERIRALIKEIENNPNVIVFIDEIHTLVGAGSTPGSMDAANILKPALARGTIQCIGATTLDEYRNSIEKDGALERRFQKILVEPTTREETLQILKNIKDRYENHHHVTYTDEAIEACVKLTDRYVSERHFPDKAIDALDEVGSKKHLTSITIPSEITELENQLSVIMQKKLTAAKNQNFELAAGYREKEVNLQSEIKRLTDNWTNGDSIKREEITEQDVAAVVSMMTGVPVQRMAEEEGIRIKGMAAQLKSLVIAQDSAIDKMVKAIQRNRVGLKEKNHPIGAFMFLGPTGVGKTYLAKKLAEFMFGSEDALIRVDMSEYTESFNVSRLIGAPPGYVGYEEGGQLTEKVRRHPYSIVLLDELEKAHGNVFNLLLQVLDEGRLTDGNGRFVDFRNSIIIMTSNAGTRQLKDFGRGVGFNSSQMGIALNEQDKEHARSIVQKALSKQFSPEFLNRLDEIITFDQLDLEAIRKIVDIELAGLSKRIEAIGYKLEVSDETKMRIAEKGYDVQFGARPLKRAIQTYIEDDISERIINNEVNYGDVIRI